MNGDGYRRLSLWLDRCRGSLTPRESLRGDLNTDIAIVGAGFTGLWTAYYLQRADPSLRIVVLEKEVAGFGASGRNGGWCSALFPTSWERIAREHGTDASRAMRDAMRRSVLEVGEAAASESIDCDYHRGGTVTFARNPAQVARGRAETRQAADGGDDDLRWLDATATATIAGIRGALGATFTPHCAVIDPARLVRGLAELVTARGVRLHERTPVTGFAPHRLTTPWGTVTADVVVRATEAFTVDIPGHRRDLAPIYSMIVATEPLPDRVLDAVGLADRPSFADLGHLICYGQRTADGRIAFGGRGAPYHFGSSLRDEFDDGDRVFENLRHQLVTMFPALQGVRFSHAWGGAVAAARDWRASVGFDRTTGIGWAGGYVGDGVATANLAGRTLADLITDSETELTRLPWVGHRSRRWEPEPLRFLGINAALALTKLADRQEGRRGRPARAAALLSRLMGG